MLAIILLSFAIPSVSDMTTLEQFSANLANPAEGDKLTDEWAAQWTADRQAVDDAKSRKYHPPYKCPPWKPGQKGGLLKLVSVDDLRNRTPNEFEECADKRAEDAAAYYNRTHPRLTDYQRQQARIMALTGDKGITATADLDLTPNIDAELAAQAASVAKADKLKARDSKAGQPTMPISYIVGGGLLILIIGYGAGVRRRKALPASS